ncbi:mechanosensitive ion channel protein MscS [Pediococcus pentosaceus]|mgnify:FL=1|jgi:small conductance mechanosensitive channel|uniref:mechanosensitive ion channel family protein n=1 Tax=Pediococcus pentosaceus TaxID=1255 RepID=UPI000C07E1A2|nr:mechanosensitive ion channel domain-containing protein [Pediococcus pentosaceus]MCI1285791.1 mechanosensitive ion channel family protein [Pediococcus pentosaceus]MCI1295098.1 mechanosensitive ion channel family protein [Pediococcus pentosaceus]MCI1488086.1 mechanosensitive ion channel family protein [Pediococcus pentosaceus]MCI2960779.1 mechanosensitive ion channel family protein [Pediococcus pentosaceus]MCT3024012.1 mechanosensitive ion channel protein MscS [Pediococcus pentosaceus]
MKNMLTIAAGFPSLKSSFTHIDWEKIGVAFMEHFFQLVLITLIFWIINRIGKHIIRNSFQHHDPIEKQSARSQTVYAVVKNIFKYSVLFFYVYTILSNLGVPVGTLLAGAGILSVAIGLGTQGIVSDVINGLTILIEGQLRVGDSVTIQSIDGTVVSIGLRTIELQALDGTLHYLPNRSISTISNHSRGSQTISIFLRISDPFEIDRAKDLLRDQLASIKQDTDKIKATPIVLAPVVEKTYGYLGVQISAKVKAGYQTPMKTMILDRCLRTLAQEQIKIQN